jgi:mono/diheme cytochrome c family protein
MRTRRSHIYVLGTVGALVLAFAAQAFASANATTATKTITVTAGDYHFKFTSKTAPVGSVLFVVKNVGKVNHTFKVNGKVTPLIKPKTTVKLTVKFAKAGTFAYLSTVAGQAAQGMKGTFAVTAPASTGGSITAGKVVWTNTGCGACHTIKAAGSTGMVGPNLDVKKPVLSLILDRVTNGRNAMPAYKSQLSATQIQDVSAYVYASTK